MILHIIILEILNKLKERVNMKLNWLKENMDILTGCCLKNEELKVISSLQEVDFDLDCLTINEIKVLDVILTELTK